MRITVLFLLALAGFAGPSGSVSHAQSSVYPWCVVYTGDQADGATHCMFVSYAQCMQTATPGSGAFCTRNPFVSVSIMGSP